MTKSNINKILVSICLLLIILTVYSLFIKASTGKETIKAHAGLIDLSSKDFSRDSAVFLGGEWAFYYNRFIDPLDKNSVADGFIQVPRLWNSFQYDGKSIGSDAYGTYRLKVRLSGSESILGLKLPSMSSCYRLYINGNLVNKNGEPGISRQTEVPQWKPEIAFFAPASTELDIVVHISNFHHTKGGMWGNILMGSKEDIVRYRDVNLMRSYLLFGILIIAAVFMFALSMIEKNFPCLNLGLFCLFSALREITVREVAIWNIAGFVSFDFLSRLEYITMPFGILFFTMFINNLYKKESNSKIYFALTFVSYALILLTLIAELRIFSKFLNAYILNALIAFAYSVFVAAKSFIKGNSSSGIVLIGVIVLLLAGVNDTLYMERINNNYGAAHSYAIAFTVFLLCQIYVVFANISHNYQKARQAAETQLMLLQSQIRPHFFYNILNTVQHLVDENPAKAKKLLHEFADYLRSKFKYSFSTNTGFISIKEELDLVNSYVYMSNARFSDRIDLVLDIDDRLQNCMIPSFLIQPVVENSVRHGLSEGRLEIHVCVKEKESNLIISVKDNGSGMSRIQLYNLFENKNVISEETGGSGIGLKNVRMRMKLYYNSDIKILSEKGRGTEVIFTLPLDSLTVREEVKC